MLYYLNLFNFFVTKMVQENSDDDHILTLKNLNPAVKNVEYSVGYSNISIRASQLENELKNVWRVEFKFIFYF